MSCNNNNQIQSTNSSTELPTWSLTIPSFSLQPISSSLATLAKTASTGFKELSTLDLVLQPQLQYQAQMDNPIRKPLDFKNLTFLGQVGSKATLETLSMRTEVNFHQVAQASLQLPSLREVIAAPTINASASFGGQYAWSAHTGKK